MRGVPQQHDHIQIRQRIRVDVIELAVLRPGRIGVENLAGFDEANPRRRRRRHDRDALQRVAHRRQDVARCGEVEKGRVTADILLGPNVLEETAILAPDDAGALLDDLFRDVEDAIEMGEGHRRVDGIAVLQLDARAGEAPILRQQSLELLAVKPVSPSMLPAIFHPVVVAREPHRGGDAELRHVVVLQPLRQRAEDIVQCGFAWLGRSAKDITRELHTLRHDFPRKHCPSVTRGNARMQISRLGARRPSRSGRALGARPGDALALAGVHRDPP